MAVLATDDFNRADKNTSDSTELDSASPVHDWTASGGFFKLLTNTARAANAGADAAEFNNDVTWPDDQYAKATLGTVSATGGLGSGYGVVVRAAAGTNAYRLVGNDNGWELLRFVAGAGTALSSNTSTVFATGDTIELRCSGVGATVTFVALKNDVEFSLGAGQTDTHADRRLSGNPGVGHSSTTDAADGVDSWEGGDLILSSTTLWAQSVM